MLRRDRKRQPLISARPTVVSNRVVAKHEFPDEGGCAGGLLKLRGKKRVLR